MKNKIFILLGFLLILLFSYNYIYKSHRDVAAEDAFVKTTTTAFISELNDLGSLPTKYINKTLQLTGLITSSSEKEITLDETLFFQLTNKTSTLPIGEKITIKARCLGYDELLDEVKFDQSYIIK